MRESIARTTRTSSEPSPVTHPRNGRVFRPQTRFKSIVDAAAPLSPAEWLDREILRLTESAIRPAAAAESITEALRIAGDRSNPYATAAAAEYLSVVRLPDRPQRNARLVGGGQR